MSVAIYGLWHDLDDLDSPPNQLKLFTAIECFVGVQCAFGTLSTFLFKLNNVLFLLIMSPDLQNY